MPFWDAVTRARALRERVAVSRVTFVAVNASSPVEPRALSPFLAISTSAALFKLVQPLEKFSDATQWPLTTTGIGSTRTMKTSSRIRR